MRRVIATVLLAFVIPCTSCGTCDEVEGGRFASPTGEFTVLTNGSDCGPLLSEFDSYVQIEKPHDFRGHNIWTSKKTLAGWKLSFDKLGIKWASDKHVEVHCRCSKDALDFKIEQWGDLTVTYTFDQ